MIIDKPSCRLLFGKYRGKTVEEIVKEQHDASYIKWCQGTLNCFNLPKSYMKEIEQRVMEERETWREWYFEDGSYSQ